MSQKKKKIPTPNFDRVYATLSIGGLAGKYTKEDGFPVDLAEVFKSWFVDEEFDDETLVEEFGGDLVFNADNHSSFFMEYLEENHQAIQNSMIESIWKDLSDAFEDKVPQKEAPSNFSDVSIKISKQRIPIIEELMKKQCPSLTAGGKKVDIALYSILELGKTRFHLPLLTYLVDSSGRCGIQRRKKYKKSFKNIHEFNNKFQPMKGLDFINTKCKGLDKLDMTSIHRSQFKEMCRASIECFGRRILKPLSLKPEISINDSFIEYSNYIFSSYKFVQQYVSQMHSPLPCQFDIVILPKSCTNNVLGDDGNDNGDDSSDDSDHDHENDDYKYSNDDPIGDISARLKASGTEYKSKNDVVHGTVHRNMSEYVTNFVGSKRCQRCIIVIDRRENNGNNGNGKDVLYVYQPKINNKNKKKPKSHSFESDPNRFLNEGLFANSKASLFPRMDADQNSNIGQRNVADDEQNDESSGDIGINCDLNGRMFCLSFHCFAQDEVRVYLNINGCCSRFFIQDIKYFLGAYFMKGEEEKLIKQWTGKTPNKDFMAAYDAAKARFQDEKFERFYKQLLDTKSGSH